MISKDKLIIAVDFDGTIVEDAYPGIGEPRIFAFETLKRLQQDGHKRDKSKWWFTWKTD